MSIDDMSIGIDLSPDVKSAKRDTVPMISPASFQFFTIFPQSPNVVVIYI